MAMPETLKRISPMGLPCLQGGLARVYCGETQHQTHGGILR